MTLCKHCHKHFKKGNGKGSLKTHLAAVKAARTKNTGRKKKKKKHTRFQCPGTEKTRNKDGDKIPCKKNHFIGPFIAAQKIALSEGIYLKKLERKVGSSGIVFNTSTSAEIPDIVTYKNGRIKFYEIKPKNPRTEEERLLRQHQAKWIRKNAKNYSIYLVYYDVNDDLIFSHSKPILLTKKNISDYSRPLNENKKEKIKRIRCRSLINKKKLEMYTKEITLHSYKILKKMIAY